MAEHNVGSDAQALVFGASGLAGWGVVNQLLENYPAKSSFSGVTALVNRPLSIESSYWPSLSPLRPRLNLVCGIELLHGSVEEFASLLKEKVEDIANVTHVFYCAYKQEHDADVEVKVNRAMLKRAVGALNKLSPQLKFVVFPSGTKGYGIHIPGGVFTAPYKESMTLPESVGAKVHYSAFQNLLKEHSRGRNWTWCEVRPDAIIGFVPNGSTFNLTAHWASYLSTYALVEGKGAKVPFPGTQNAYTSLFNEASAETIARFSIWAALHPEKTGGGQLFNIADQATPSRMAERWPVLAKYFGLEGSGPIDDRNLLSPGEYIKKHRHLSLAKARYVGFLEEIDPNSSWFTAFDRFKKAGMIPP